MHPAFRRTTGPVQKGAAQAHSMAVVAAAVGFAAGEPLHAPYGEALRLLPDTASQGGQRRRNRRQAVALLIPQPGRTGEAGFRSRPQRRQQGQRRQQVRDIRQVYLLRQTTAQGRRRPVPLEGVPAQARDGHSTAQGPYRQPEGRCGPVRLRVQGHGSEPLPTRYREAAIRLADMHAAATQHRQRQVYIGAGGQGAGQRQLRVCRQTGQGHQQPGEQLRRPGPVHRNLPAGQRPGHPQTARRGRKAPVPRQGPLQQPLRAGEHRAHLAPGHGQGQQKPQGAAAGPAVDDGGLFVIQGPQPPDRGLHIVGGVRRAGKLSRLGQTDQLPVQQAFGRRRCHRPPQRGRKQAHVHHTSSIRAARGTVSRRPWPARSATAMVMPSPPRFLSRAR